MGVQRVHFHPAGYESDAGMRGSPQQQILNFLPQTRQTDTDPALRQREKNYPLIIQIILSRAVLHYMASSCIFRLTADARELKSDALENDDWGKMKKM
jgi:hypothetical protein